MHRSRRHRRRARDHRRRQRPGPAAMWSKTCSTSRSGSARGRPMSRQAGAQGNALKTLVAMPFVLDGQAGRVEIDARGLRHRITLAVDPIRQQPVIRHQRPGIVKAGGSRVVVRWPKFNMFTTGNVSPRAICTNRRGLRLAEPASRAVSRLVRNAGVLRRGDQHRHG